MQGIVIQRIDPEVLENMRTRGGKWAAYESEALDAANCGRLQFLQYVGIGSSFGAPPQKYPHRDQHGMSLGYLLTGYVNLRTGAIESTESIRAPSLLAGLDSGDLPQSECPNSGYPGAYP
ncbi:MAG: hypothetical protein H0X25_16515 [Acidobacteriales bacterium]|nr:hypothetical protein [Terriglobales bacterium]